ncbi:MAG: hypothetical protein FLDDKLPJ_02216 [Phycisphaerae bacterium]|nr:hypothetical protein [Phycisphaerae bacterium]
MWNAECGITHGFETRVKGPKCTLPYGRGSVLKQRRKVGSGLGASGIGDGGRGPMGQHSSAGCMHRGVGCGWGERRCVVGASLSAGADGGVAAAAHDVQMRAQLLSHPDRLAGHRVGGDVLGFVGGLGTAATGGAGWGVLRVRVQSDGERVGRVSGVRDGDGCRAAGRR